MKFGPTIPILRIFDETKAREFYIDFLGFQVDWTHRFEAALPLYMQISRAGCVLHLSEHHGDATPGSALRIESPELSAYHQELSDRPYGYCRPGLETRPWGYEEMAVTDPFGNRLVFARDLDS